MIYNVFAIHDSALGEYMVPMFFQSRGQMIRSFSDEVNRVATDNMMNRHPEHFRLFYVGTYNSETGLFETLPPEFVVGAVDVVQPLS